MKELLRVAIRRALFISVWIKTGRRNRRAAGWPRVEDYGIKNFAALLAITLMLLVVACQKVEAPVPTEKDGEQVWHNLLKKDHGIELLSFKKINGQLEGSLPALLRFLKLI